MSPTPPLLRDLRFSVIGTGAVGQSLANWIVALGGTPVHVSARPGSARLAHFARRLGVSPVAAPELSTGAQDLLLIAVPDGELGGIAELLAQRPQATVALHVSGFAPAAVLAPLRSADTAIGGFHPLRAFAVPEVRVEEASGVFFALDGDPEAITLGRQLAEALGATCAVITAERRPLYHLVATLMAGAVTTVVSTAMEIATCAGLPEEVRAGFAKLATDALATAVALPDPAAGITGPAARGDQETLLHELLALERKVPDSVPVVVALARESLRQRSRLIPLDPPRQALADLLSRPELLDLMKDRVLTSSSKPPG